jgi:hypothetical protein
MIMLPVSFLNDDVLQKTIKWCRWREHFVAFEKRAFQMMQSKVFSQELNPVVLSFKVKTKQKERPLRDYIERNVRTAGRPEWPATQNAFNMGYRAEWRNQHHNNTSCPWNLVVPPTDTSGLSSLIAPGKTMVSASDLEFGPLCMFSLLCHANVT